MSRGALYAAVGLVAASGAVAACWLVASRPADLPVAGPSAPVQAALLCPWREPKRDLAALFPKATGTRTETRILSGARLELARRLGRAPAAEENALHVHRVLRGAEAAGSIVVRRVKGEYGAIEIVIGVGRDGRVRGVRVQRLREPRPIAAELTSPRWLATFAGASAQGGWKAGDPAAAVVEPARRSAAAVAEGVRSGLVLLETAERKGLSPGGEHEH